MSDMDSLITLDRSDHPAALASWWANFVAGKIGILPPVTAHTAWLRLHRSEAAACMTLREYGLLSQQMGWNTK